MNRFKKVSRTLWVLASVDGYLLAEGHPDPKMPPYHLDSMMGHVPALAAAPNRITLRDVRRQWNSAMRAKGYGHVYGLVHECKVKITIEETTWTSRTTKGNRSRIRIQGLERARRAYQKDSPQGRGIRQGSRSGRGGLT